MSSPALRRLLNLEGSDSGEWFTPGRFAVLLGLLLLASFPDVWLGSGTFVFRDFGRFGYPLAHHFRESFWRGEVPLLNPLNDFGLPFLAQWNTLTVYPPSLIYLLLPLSWSLAVFCLLHLFLGGMGMYQLASNWTGSRFAGAVAGLAFAFNGLSLHCLMWPNNIAALGWMPWVVWAVERAWRLGGRNVYGAALVGALQMLAGAPEIIIQTWILIGALWVLHLWSCQGMRVRVAGRFFGVLLLVLGLAAVQLLPFLDLLAHSHRSADYGGGTWPMPATGWMNLLIPLFDTFSWDIGVRSQYEQQWTSSYYPGVAVLALAVLACWRVRQGRVWLLGSLLIFSLVLALGGHGPIHPLLQEILPATGFIRFPVKFVVLAVFLIPLIAAHAVRDLESTPLRERPETARALTVCGLVLLALMAVGLWFARSYPRFPDLALDWKAILVNGMVRAGFLAVGLGLLGWLHWKARSGSLLLRLGLLALLFLDVLTHMPSQNPRVARSAYDEGMVKLEPKPQPGRSRVMISPDANRYFFYNTVPDAFEDFIGHRLGLMANCNLFEGLPKVDGFFSLYLRHERPVRLALYPDHKPYPARLADFAAVSQITQPNKLIEWESRPTALPFANIGQIPIFATDEAVLTALTGETFDPAHEVYLPPEVREQVTATNRVTARILSSDVAAHRLEFETESDGPALLVLSQAYYHPWQATVDGRETMIWRANHGFQAVEVPAGKHRVRMVYRDRGFQAGLGISFAALVLCGFGLRRRGAGRTLHPAGSANRSGSEESACSL